MATLLPYCLRLTCTITNAGPRLAFSGMTDTLLDGISTRITMHPCFVAHYVINFDYPWMPPLYFVWFARPALIIQRRLFYGTSFIATCVHDSPQLCWGGVGLFQSTVTKDISITGLSIPARSAPTTPINITN